MKQPKPIRKFVTSLAELEGAARDASANNAFVLCRQQNAWNDAKNAFESWQGYMTLTARISRKRAYDAQCAAFAAITKHQAKPKKSNEILTDETPEGVTQA